MAFSIHCQACNSRYCLDEDLFERRVAGRVARFKCPNCGASSAINAVSKGSLKPLESRAEEPELRLRDSDFAAEEREIAELTDEEVASLPPESLKPVERKPVPRPRLESKIDDELWVVSAKEGVDDQEIFESSLVHQIAEGKMPSDAIVWREGMQDWLPLADVPELAKHLPVADDKTGGFLGTGIRATFGSNSGERKSAPPPLPPKKRSYGSANKKSGGHKSGDARGTKPVALSPGFLFSVDDAESEPPTPAPEEAKPAKGVPKPPLRGPRRAVTRDLDFSDIAEEEEPPVSGTPALSQLTTRDQRSRSSTTNPFFAGLGGNEEQVLGPPSIDISDLAAGVKSRERSGEQLEDQERTQGNDAPASRQSDVEPAEPSSERLGKKKRGKSERPRSSKRPSSRPLAGTSAARPGSTSRPRAGASEAPTAASQEPRQRWLSPGRIAVLLALAGLAYLLFSRQMRQADEPIQEAPAQAESPKPMDLPQQREGQQVVGEPERAEPTDIEPDPTAAEPTPEVPDAQRTPGRAQQQAPQPLARENKPAVVEQPSAPAQQRPAAAPPAAPKPATAPKSNVDAPPFDKAAAVAALGAVVAQASGCRQEGDPSGTARVVVTFAPSGRVTSATLSGPPFAGTRTGGCIASTMRRARVPPFSGDHVTVAKSVVIR